METDLNTLVAYGDYVCPANADAVTLINCPTTTAFIMEVRSSSSIHQWVKEYNSGNSWSRCYQDWNDTWTSWIPNGGKASLVATYSSGTSCYRKWSDGWIEQGGIYNIPTSSTGDQDFTVTLLL